jgi:exopolyphosphatase / guanosine-5'-triphosphate,3'-diphosphate pyrophosphatase
LSKLVTRPFPSASPPLSAVAETGGAATGGPAPAAPGRTWPNGSGGRNRSDRGAWERPAATFAALDLGTNNCRLLVARRAGANGFRVVDAFSRIVRLGEGLGATGRLTDAAMDRTIDALRVCATRLAQRGVTRGRYVATEACRRAANCGEFLDRVRRETGIAIEIIDSDEEARLAVAGCAPLLAPAVPHAVIFDIGGGSNEIAWLHRTRPGGALQLLGLVSLPYGVVSLTERYGGDSFTEASYGAMVAEMRATLAPFEARHGIARHIDGGKVQMLGSSGTVTTLAGIRLDLPRYSRAAVDGTLLDFADIVRCSRRLAALDFAGRAAHPCIGPERADLVVAGCAILEAICATWPVGRLRVADRGVREGILMDLAADRGGNGRIRR